jgi:hypothetical protein
MVFRTRRILEESNKGSHGATSAMSRVAFEKYCSDVRRHVMRASSRQLSFWSELAEPCPDLSRLHTLALDCSSSIRSAEYCFEEIFKLSPQALVQMRLCAAFHINVTGNTEKATILLAEAERVEDARSKEHRLESGSQLDILSEKQLDIWGDSTAVVNLSSQPRELGVIQTLNAAACKLVGQQRIQLERRSAFSLLPPLLDKVFEASLRQYAANGEARFGMVDYSRVVLVCHKNGSLVPVLSSIKDAPIDEGQTFIWAMRELRTDTEFALVDSTTGQVLALTGGAAQLFNVDLSNSASYPFLTDLFPDWGLPGTQEELGRTGGGSAVLRIRPMEAALSSSDDEEEEEEGEGMDGGDGADSLEGARSRDDDDEEEEVEKKKGGGVGAAAAAVRAEGEGQGAAAALLAAPSADDGEDALFGGHEEEGKGALAPPPPPTAPPPQAAMPTVSAMSKLKQQGGGRLHVKPRAPSSRAGGTTSLRFSAAAAVLAPLTLRVRLQTLRFPEGELDVLHLHRSTASDKSRGRLGSSSVAVKSAALVVKASSSSSSSSGTSRGGFGFGRGKQQPQLPSPPPNTQPHVGALSLPPLASSPLDGSSSAAPSQPSGASGAAGEGVVSIIPVPSPFGPPTHLAKASSGASVGSGGGRSSSSAGSRMSTLQSISRAMSRLRRIVSNENPSLMPGLYYLRIAGLLLTLLCAILAAVASIESQDQFGNLYTQVKYSDVSVQRIVSKSLTIYTTQKLVFHYRNITLLTPTALLARRGYVLGNLSHFQEAHLSLFSLAQQLGLSEEWTTNYVTLYTFGAPSRGVAGNTEVVNHATAGTRLSSIVNALAVDNGGILGAGGNGWDTDPPLLASMSTDFLRMGNGHEVFSATITSGFADVVEGVARLRTNQLYVFVAMMVSTSAVGLLIFFPILKYIDRVSDGIMLEFVAIPTHVRKVLQEQSVLRLRALRKDNAGEEGEEDFSDDEEDGGLGESALGPSAGVGADAADAVAMSGAQSNSGDRDTDMQREAEMWARVFNSRGVADQQQVVEGGATQQLPPVATSRAGGKTGTGSRKSKGPEYKKSSWSFCSLLGKFMFPLLLLFGLFSFIFGNFYIAANKVLALSAASVASGQRFACTIQSVVALNKMAIARVDPASRNLLFYYGLKAANCIKDNNALLSFDQASSGLTNNYAFYTGAPENGLPSSLPSKLTQELYSAAFGNACLWLASFDAAFDIQRCSAFEGGVVTLGLSAVISKFYAKFYSLLDEQLRTTFVEGGSNNVSGFTESGATFNYAARPCTTAVGCKPSYVTPFLRTPLSPSYVPSSTWKFDIPAGVTPPNSVPYVPQDFLNGDSYHVLEDFIKLYLKPGLSHMQDLYVLSTKEALKSYLSLIGVFIPAAVTGIVLYIVFWWLPLTGEENKSIMNKRAMLLFIPAPVVHNMPNLKQMIATIVARDGDEHISKGSRSSSKILPT